MDIRKISFPIIFLTVLLIITTSLRIYRLPEMANFDFDQEYVSNFAYAVLKEYPIQLIGQGLSVDGLFMGPIYFYYLVPFYAATQLHPLGGYIGSILLGILITLVYFLVGRAMFGTATGLLAALFSTALYSTFERDWNMTPAFSSEFMVMLTWFCLYKYWHGQTKFLIPLAFLFGLYTSIHPILFPFYLVFSVLFVIKRNLPNIKTSLFSAGVLIIPILPLLIFEYLRNFLEVKRLFTVFFESKSDTLYLDKLTNNLEIVAASTYGLIPSIIPIQIPVALLFGVICLLFIKKIGLGKDHFHLITLVITYIAFIFYYTFYPGHVTEYYFLALSVLFMFYVSALLGFLFNKYPFKLLIFIYFGYLLITSFNSLKYKWDNPSLITLAHKDAVVKEIVARESENRDFYVSYIKSLGWNFGFNYLFKLYARIPQTVEAKPPIYTIVIPKELSPDSINFYSGNVGLILPDN